MPREEHNWLQRNSSTVLCALYIISLLFMLLVIATLVIFMRISKHTVEKFWPAHQNYEIEYPLSIMMFFGTANAMVIFRIFTLNVFVIIVHIFLHVMVLICLIFFTFIVPGYDNRSFPKLYQIPAFIVFTSYALQSLVALHLVLFRPGRTPIEHDQRSGAHAFIGCLTLALQLWNVLLHISMMCAATKHVRKIDETYKEKDILVEPMILTAFIFFYFLLIQAILLTPYFETESRIVMFGPTKEEEDEPEIESGNQNQKQIEKGSLNQKQVNANSKARKK